MKYSYKFTDQEHEANSSRSFTVFRAKNSLFWGILLMVLSLFAFTNGAMLSAQTNTEIRMKVNAPKGQKLRIQLEPFDGWTITGASKGDYYGEYYLDADNGEVVVSGEVTSLECFGNMLSELTIQSAPALAFLKCYKNELTSVDLSKAPKLVYLDCKANNLSTLNIAANTELETLLCQDNSLTELITGDVATLKKIDCSHNKLSSLSLTGNIGLEDLYCHNNQLTYVDLSANINLWGLYIYGNQIAKDNMTRLVENMPIPPLGPPYFYVVDTRNAAEGNECFMSDVAIAEGKGWAAYDYAGGIENGAMIGVPYKGKDFVPRISNHSITMTFDKAVGEEISLEISGEADGVEIVGVEGSAPFVGKQNFILTKETIEIKGDVTKLICTGNNVIALTSTGGSVLTDLDCSDNQLSNLHITNETALKKLCCQKNELLTLDVSGCTALERIDCYNNQLRAEGMTSFVKTLPTQTNYPQLFVIDTQSPSGKDQNIVLKSDVSIANERGWDVKDYINGGRWGFGQDYTGTDPVYYAVTVEATMNGTVVVEHETPRNILEGSLVTLKVIPEAGYTLSSLTANEVDIKEECSFYITANTSIKATFKEKTYYQVTVAKEGEGSVRIEGADDLSKVEEESELQVICTPANGWQVKTIMAGDVDITATGKFVVTQDTDIKVVFESVAPQGSYVSITREIVGDLSINYTTGTHHLPIVEGGEILRYQDNILIIKATEKTVKIYGPVTNLLCLYGQITELDVSHAPELEELNCALNPLTQLDLSQNAALQSFSGEINNFTNLDFSGCPLLTYVNVYGNQIKGDNMTALIESLPVRQPKDNAALIIYDGTYENEGNECLMAHVKQAKSKYWMPYDLNGGAGTIKPYEGKDVAIQEIPNFGFSLAPNPVQDYLEITGADSYETMQIINLSGVVVFEGKTDASGCARWDASLLPAGTYLILGNKKTAKIVKQ